MDKPTDSVDIHTRRSAPVRAALPQPFRSLQVTTTPQASGPSPRWLTSASGTWTGALISSLIPTGRAGRRAARADLRHGGAPGGAGLRRGASRARLDDVLGAVHHGPGHRVLSHELKRRARMRLVRHRGTRRAQCPGRRSPPGPGARRHMKTASPVSYLRRPPAPRQESPTRRTRHRGAPGAGRQGPSGEKGRFLHVTGRWSCRNVRSCQQRDELDWPHPN